MNTPPILTAEDAGHILGTGEWPQKCVGAFAAIRDKRTVCIPVRSEDELREMFDKQYGHIRGTYQHAYWNIWLACARAIQGEGT